MLFLNGAVLFAASVDLATTSLMSARIVTFLFLSFPVAFLTSSATSSPLSIAALTLTVAEVLSIFLTADSTPEASRVALTSMDCEDLSRVFDMSATLSLSFSMRDVASSMPVFRPSMSEVNATLMLPIVANA